MDLLPSKATSTAFQMELQQHLTLVCSGGRALLPVNKPQPMWFKIFNTTKYEQQSTKTKCFSWCFQITLGHKAIQQQKNQKNHRDTGFQFSLLNSAVINTTSSLQLRLLIVSVRLGLSLQALQDLLAVFLPCLGSPVHLLLVADFQILLCLSLKSSFCHCHIQVSHGFTVLKKDCRLQFTVWNVCIFLWAGIKKYKPSNS